MKREIININIFYFSTPPNFILLDNVALKLQTFFGR
jgi:hypothetical protein